MLNDNKKQRLRMYNLLILVVIISIMLMTLIIQDESSKRQNRLEKTDKMQVYFINVGQGDSTLIILNNKVMLIDCGLYDESDNVIETLDDLNIKRIDVLIGTHTHRDHMGGMSKIIDKYNIGKLYTPKEYGLAQLENFCKLWYYGFQFERVLNGIENYKIAMYDKFEFGKANVSVIAPLADTKKTIKNNYSLVLKIEYGDTSILVTGDCQDNEEYEILQSKQDISADIIKVPHHGSISSSNTEFVEAVNPDYAVVSVGDNNYGQPNDMVMKRYETVGAKIYRTDYEGTIHFETEGKSIQKIEP